MLRNALNATLGLAVFAASLCACTNTAPIDTQAVTNENAAQMIGAVRDSSLKPAEKREFETFVRSNEQRQEAYEGKTVREVINAELAFETGKRLEREDRANDAARRAAMAQLIALNVVKVSDRERGIELVIDGANRTEKPIVGFDAGLEIDDAASHKRIGLAELHVMQALNPKSRAKFTYPMRFVRFGEDTGTMRLAAGRPKVARLDVFGVRFAASPKAEDD